MAEGKELNKYREAQRRYLAASKGYASALAKVADLDPHILASVRKIHEHGNRIHHLDSLTMTKTYNQLREKSQIDKKYFSAHENLLKTKSELDQAAYLLAQARINLILAKAGIAKVRHNLSALEQVERVVSPKATQIERISLALPLIKDQIIRLEKFVDAKEIVSGNGSLVAQTRDARAFLRSLEAAAISAINDAYFREKKRSSQSLYSEVKNGKTTLVELIREVGDVDHVRELERRLSAGDVTVVDGNVLPVSEKGGRYTRLLVEELDATLEKRLSRQMRRDHRVAFAKDPLYGALAREVDSLQKKSNEIHSHLAKLPKQSSLADLTNKLDNNVDVACKSWKSLLTDVNALADSAIAVRKQLMALKGQTRTSQEKILSILTAAKLLENYQGKISRSADLLAVRLGVQTPLRSFRTLPTHTDILEGNITVNMDDIKARAESEVMARLSSREVFKKTISRVVTDFVLGSESFQCYQQVEEKIDAITGHLYGYLESEKRLDLGAGHLYQLMSDLVELEVERQETLASLLHEAELTHKKLWLTSVRNENKNHIEKNLRTSNVDSLNAAHKTNQNITEEVEKAVEKLLADFGSGHEKHANKFLSELRAVGGRVTDGEDITKVSADIKEKYRDYLKQHNADLEAVDREMKHLDKILSTFPEKSKKLIEKALITDIKSKALL